MRIAIAGAAVLCVLPFSLPGRQPRHPINADAARSEINVQSLRGNISVPSGSGGDIGVLSDAGGKASRGTRSS